MRLAIIIPTYNSLDTLKVLVKQLFKHTKGDFKVFVIEDGQREDTIKWLIRPRKTMPISIIFHKENKGVAPSWNDGLKVAYEGGCTHFAVLNDDVGVPKDWWKECREKFKADIHLLSLDAPCPIPIITGWFFVLDRVCLETVGYFDEQFAPFTSEDTDYAYRYQASGLKWSKIKLDVKHHHGGSTTMNKIEYFKFKEIQQENWNKLRKKYPKIRMQQQ